MRKSRKAIDQEQANMKGSKARYVFSFRVEDNQDPAVGKLLFSAKAETKKQLYEEAIALLRAWAKSEKKKAN